LIYVVETRMRIALSSDRQHVRQWIADRRVPAQLAGWNREVRKQEVTDAPRTDDQLSRGGAGAVDADERFQRCGYCLCGCARAGPHPRRIPRHDRKQGGRASVAVAADEGVKPKGMELDHGTDDGFLRLDRAARETSTVLRHRSGALALAQVDGVSVRSLPARVALHAWAWAEMAGEARAARS